MTSRQTRIEDPRNLDPHRGLVGDRSHLDINMLIQGRTNQDRKSILISDDETTQQRRPIDVNFYKRKSVYERLGGSSTSLLNTNINTLKENRHYQLGNDQSNTKRPKYDSNNIQAESYNQNKKNQHDKTKESLSNTKQDSQQQNSHY